MQSRNPKTKVSSNTRRTKSERPTGSGHRNPSQASNNNNHEAQKEVQKNNKYEF